MKHSWPPDPTPASECAICGIRYWRTKKYKIKCGEEGKKRWPF